MSINIFDLFSHTRKLVNKVKPITNNLRSIVLSGVSRHSAIVTNVVLGTDANESLQGSPNDDFIDSKSGYDVIVAGDGNDIMTYSPTATYNGGAGIDWITAVRNGYGININMSSAVNVENLAESQFSDTVTDNSLNNTILAGAGDDQITIKGGGNDYVDTGDGKNIVNVYNSGGTTTIKGNSTDRIRLMDVGSTYLLNRNGNDLVIKFTDFAKTKNSYIVLDNWYISTNHIKGFISNNQQVNLETLAKKLVSNPSMTGYTKTSITSNNIPPQVTTGTFDLSSGNMFVTDIANPLVSSDRFFRIGSDSKYASVQYGLPSNQTITGTSGNDVISAFSKVIDTNKTYGLLIGVNNSTVQGANPLSAPVVDATQFGMLVESASTTANHQITKITDSSATIKALDNYLANLLTSVKPGDDVMIFESGHGSGGRLVLYDGCYNAKTLLDKLQQVKNRIGSSGTVTFITDSCYSGTMVDYARNNHYSINVIGASAANQPSYEVSSRGLLTTALTQSLMTTTTDTNMDNKLSLSEVFTATATKTSKIATNIGVSQNPDIYIAQDTNIWDIPSCDTLNGGAGNDILIGGLGNTIMNGGVGIDSYYINAGTTRIINNATGDAADTLVLPDSVKLSDLHMYRVGNDLSLFNNAQYGTVNLAGWFTVSDPNKIHNLMIDNSNYSLNTNQISNTLISTNHATLDVSNFTTRVI